MALKINAAIKVRMTDARTIAKHLVKTLYRHRVWMEECLDLHRKMRPVTVCILKMAHRGSLLWQRLLMN